MGRAGYAIRVRLTVDGKSQTQPITVKIDPRVKVTPVVQQIFTLTTQMEDGAMAAEAAAKDARAAAEKLRATPQSAANDALIKELDAIAPAAGRRLAAAPVVAAAAAVAVADAVVVAEARRQPRPRPVRPVPAPRRAPRRPRHRPATSRRSAPRWSRR